MKRKGVLAGLMSQPVKFGLVGALNTVVGYMSYLLLLALSSNYVFSLALGHGVAIVNSFIWNKRWTFRSKGETKGEAARFLLVYAFTFVANLLALALMVERLGWDPRYSQALLLIVMPAVAFLAHRWWSFDLGED